MVGFHILRVDTLHWLELAASVVTMWLFENFAEDHSVILRNHQDIPWQDYHSTIKLGIDEVTYAPTANGWEEILSNEGLVSTLNWLQQSTI